MIVFDMCICSGNPIVTLAVTDAQSAEEMIAIQTYKMFGSNEVTSSDMKTLPQRDTCCGMESSSIVKRPEMTTLLTSQQSIGFREEAGKRAGRMRGPCDASTCGCVGYGLHTHRRGILLTTPMLDDQLNGHIPAKRLVGIPRVYLPGCTHCKSLLM